MSDVPSKALVNSQMSADLPTANGEVQYPVAASTSMADVDLAHSPMTLQDPDEEELADLEENIMQRSRTMEDFARIISEWRSDRERAAAYKGGDGASSIRAPYGLGAQAGEGSSSQVHLRIRSSIASLSAEAARGADLETASHYSYEASSVGDPDDYGSAGLRHSPSMSPSLNGAASLADGDSAAAMRVRCTCCCGRGTRKCKRARRATREWGQVESDLRLAAQIGQALLRRSDALQAELSSKQEEHGSRINSLMKKLSSSIKETGQFSKRLEQSELNLEACEASNRALVRELDEARKELSRTKSSNTRHVNLEVKLTRAEEELEDIKQEMKAEQKRSEQMKAQLIREQEVNESLTRDLKVAKIQQSAGAHITEEERTRRKEEVRKLVDARLATGKNVADVSSTGEDGGAWVESVVAQNDVLTQANKQLKALLESRNEELAQLREETNHQQHFDQDHIKPNASLTLTGAQLPSTALGEEFVDEAPSKSAPAMMTRRSVSEVLPSSPGLLSPQLPQASLLPSASPSITSEGTVVETSSDATSSHPDYNGRPTLTSTASTKREMRTAQLAPLLEMIQRLYARLSAADVETLSKRLQRQKLTGDVGHLARTTVNGILRDIDGLRDHFRRGMEQEWKGRDGDNVSVHSRTSGKSGNAPAESDSLVARKEFFALIKLFKDLFLEMARLRNAINEVSLQPQYAARILQEQLGLSVGEDKGVSAWFGRLLSTSGLPGTNATSSTLGSGSSSAAGAGGNAGALHGPGGASASGNGSGPLGRSVSSASRAPSAAQISATRASAAVVPTAVAVEVKGMHASESSTNGGDASPQPDHMAGTSPPAHARSAVARRQPSLNRTQSRNLSGLFVGSMTGVGGSVTNADMLPSQRSIASRTVSDQSRLSRIVDDDEVSLHHNAQPKARTLRPRNLSDSSMHTTYLDDQVDADDDLQSGIGRRKENRRLPTSLASANAPTPASISRVISPSTLALRANTIDDVSTSTSGGGGGTAGGFLSSLAPPRSVAKAFSLLSGAAVGSNDSSAVAPTAATQVVSPSATLTAGMPPSLRHKTSKAQLSLAATTASMATPKTG